MEEASTFFTTSEGALLVAFLIAIIIVFGAFGGYLSGLVYQEVDETDEDGADEKKPLRPSITTKQRMILGIGAATLVPFFLSLIQSDIVSNLSHEDPKIMIEAIMIFIAFCMLAGVVSQRFISALANKLLDRLKNVESEQLMARKQLEQQQKQVEQKEKEQQQMADELKKTKEQDQKGANALNMMEELLDTDDELTLDLQSVEDKVASAPDAVRSVIFISARNFRKENHRQADRIERLIPVFRGLIKAEDDPTMHQHHAQLGYVYQGIEIPDWQQAEEMFSEAIKRRDTGDKKGRFRRYELERAICRMKQAMADHLQGSQLDYIKSTIKNDLAVGKDAKPYDERMQDLSQQERDFLTELL